MDTHNLSEILRCLIINTNFGEIEIINFLRKNLKLKINLDFKKMILSVKEIILPEIITDLIYQGLSYQEIERELRSLGTFLEGTDYHLILNNMYTSVAAESSHTASLKDLLTLSKAFAKNYFLITINQAPLLFSLKIFGDRIPPLYIDFTITIEKYNEQHRFFLIKFLEKLYGLSPTIFKSKLIESITSYTSLFSKLDVLDVVLNYIEQDIFTLSSKGYTKNEIIATLKNKYPKLLDTILSSQNTLSPLQREFNKALINLKSDPNVILKKDLIKQMTDNRFIIKTSDCHYPNYTFDFLVSPWAINFRMLLTKFFNTIALNSISHLHNYIHHWIQKFIL